jgi:hypothetical protein
MTNFNEPMKYYVGITIHNAFEIEAETDEEARTQVSDMSNEEILLESDFNITYVDEVSK